MTDCLSSVYYCTAGHSQFGYTTHLWAGARINGRKKSRWKCIEYQKIFYWTPHVGINWTIWMDVVLQDDVCDDFKVFMGMFFNKEYSTCLQRSDRSTFCDRRRCSWSQPKSTDKSNGTRQYVSTICMYNYWINNVKGFLPQVFRALCSACSMRLTF